MDKCLPYPAGQNILFDFSQTLASRQDIPSILNAIKEACDLVAAIHCIHLALPVLLQERMTIHTLKFHEDEIAKVEVDLNYPDKPENLWTLPADEHHVIQDILREFVENAHDQTSRNGHLFFSLKTRELRQGILAFVNQDASSFDDGAIAFFRGLAAATSSALDQMSRMEMMRLEAELLSHEVDYLRMLLHITNTSIGTLELSYMVRKIATDIRFFFGIRTFVLALFSIEGNCRTFQMYYPEDMDISPPSKGGDTRCNVEGSLLQRVLRKGEPMVLRRERFNEIAADDPLSALCAKRDISACCMLPLRFGAQYLGMMVLAHESDIFTPHDVALLSQVASRVAIAVHNAIEHTIVTGEKEELASENLYLSELVHEMDEFGEIVGTSDAIRRVLKKIEMVATSDSTVLIMGESGTGKELFARAIHNRSNRKSRRMVKMSCAAIPATLLESELFGHEKGAFTGANSRRKGRFELADGGTLMLDEVAELPLELQPKLLRVLQEREFERLGSTGTITVDVRLVAVTNRNLMQMVGNGTFRADLFYRLSVFPIVIPPLRERREDIPLLAHFFTRKLAQKMQRDVKNIPMRTLRQLCDHSWPGNVRELANVIEHAVIVSDGPELYLPPMELTTNAGYFNLSEAFTQEAIPAVTGSNRRFHADESEDERARIIKALVESNGVVAGARGAAAKLGLKRTTLLSRMQRMGISAKV